MVQKQRRRAVYSIIVLLVGISIFPFCILFGKSFFGPDGMFDLTVWYKVFLGTPRYLYRFWKSLFLCGGIMAGQVGISIFAGYGFAKYEFAGKKILYFALMVLMILPLQVTLVPNYIVLDRLRLMGTYWSLLLPGIFVPLGTFIMTQGFQTVSDEILEAGRLDGCTEWQLLWRIAVPMRRGSVICVGILSFLDAWNMVEQPIAYLQSFEKYPLAVALASVTPSGVQIQMVCCLLALIPPVCLFMLGGRSFVKGIAVGEKGI